MISDARAEPTPPPIALAATADAGDRRFGLPTRTWWVLIRVLGGVAILGVLVWRVGADGFLAGLRMIDLGTLLLIFVIGAATTVLSAWRWVLVARGLGVTLPLGTAVTAYYRAQFLNAALPGGVLGDVHRAVRHGRDLRNLGLGVRAVVLERLAGQVVLVAAGAVVVVLLGAPLLRAIRVPTAALVAGGILIAVLAALGLVGARSTRAGAVISRTVRATVTAVRTGLLGRRGWPGIVACSALVVVGFLAMFVVAARAAGVTAGVAELLPLLTLALIAMAIPLNVGGWGPREGVCAWAFGVAGLGAAQGLAVAVIYGVSVFVASLPGAVVLAARWWRDRRSAAGQSAPNRADSA
ncbi:flippase-like domain-containing protein [Natronosporangium hydrolyticum]|uniref:Flippase-like domain-containing protein n=1 Tax=Natronosporangium hydrolyticum TaxID=2811111 RepID=A0A895YE14_9ACTN|nr:lysylphosphatidylglycerol synthase transmembrane domain-containing protein [Natronosporangium hydrolyticum]QSB12786.1 flippase-like domain-containing protein [Natronosporangium hydrolyticum]